MCVDRRFIGVLIDGYCSGGHAALKLSVDRSLPVPLGIQLRGLIEHGIVSGEFVPGEKLPSVRELAEALGVAPMTVSQVYRYLRNGGLIEARPGDGTYVAERNADAAIESARPASCLRRCCCRRGGN